MLNVVNLFHVCAGPWAEVWVKNHLYIYVQAAVFWHGTNTFWLVFKLQDIGINASFIQMRPASPQVSTFPVAAPHAPATKVHAEWLEEDEMNSPLGTENTQQQKELKEVHREGAWSLKESQP